MQYLALKRCARVLLVIAGSLLATAAAAVNCPGADSEALAWLDKMSLSMRQVSYQGVVTFQRGQDMQVVQVSHSVSDGVASERLTRLTGQGAGVVRVGHPLDCVHPGQRLLQLGAELGAGHCEVTRHYRLRVSGGERIAGRLAVRIQIEPRDMYRYGYRMELDRDTGLLLKTETIGPGNKVLEQFQFASLSYTDRDEGGTGVDIVHSAAHPHPDNVDTTSHTGMAWDVNWLPAGFIPTDRPAAGAGRRTYTDGLAVFSVFLEQLSREIRAGEGLVREGGTTSYTRGLRLAGEPVLVTVIGEVPVNTARMVADSIAGVN